MKIILIICALMLSVCPRIAAQESSLTGTWRFVSSEGTLTLKLTGDGTGALNGDRFKYVARGNRLIVEDETGQTSAYLFSIRGDALNISGGNLPGVITFTRQERSGSGVFEKRVNQQGPAGRTSGGEDESEVGLPGVWQSRNITVRISKDGTLTINGERFNYRVEGKFITLSNSEGSARVEYQLDGNTLITNYQGERTVYRRVTGSDLNSTESQGGNPADLIGKWCYMSNVNANNGGRMSNTCFTLYENGTYDYYSETSSSGTYGGTASQESDSGTWRVSGMTLTVNSRARGRLTFTLEKRNHPKTGDPMLVLDGDAFVTYAPRQPWP